MRDACRARLTKLFLFVLCGLAADAKPITSSSKAKAFYYLSNYGYVTNTDNENTAKLLTEEVVTKAIMDFQVFAGLTPTGRLDNETVALMNTPRCGVKDFVGHGSTARRKKRYALQGSRWRVDTLTWRISKYPQSGRLSKTKVDSEIRKAFELWSDVADLKFVEKRSGSVHIDIRFEKREHGDGDPFDGPGGTLAHAYFPQYGGDAHFDDQEFWTMDELKGTNLLQTAAHEFGHSLGLSHSDVRRSLMAPFYKGWQPNLKLDRDDVDAIRALYGEAKTSGDSTTTTTTNRPNTSRRPAGDTNVDNDELCDDSSIDAMFSTIDGSYYVFKGSNYWKLTADSVEPGYPRRIGEDWPGLPDNIDAAVTWEDNRKTYFFKGPDYWRFENREPSAGYPKKISDGFGGIPDNVDTAFIWTGNGKIYFFKADKYWKFDPTRKPPVRSVYPRNIANWDLPGNVEAAVKWNRRTYFFKGGRYYRFNDRSFALDKGDPPFPRNAGTWWFGCTRSSVRATNFADEDDNFATKALQGNDDASLFFDYNVEGDELLDVAPPDE